MIVTPVSESPAMIARSIGVAPRQRGSRDGCTFSISSSESRGSEISWPNAQTTPTSGAAPRTPSTASGRLTLVRLEPRSKPSSRAASAAGGDAIRRPLPFGRSGCVTTRLGLCGEAASRRRTVTANSDVPR